MAHKANGAERDTHNTRTCHECNGTLLARGYKHVEQVGKAEVTDGTAMVPRCSDCGEPQLTLDDLAGYERRAAAVVLRDGAHVDGSVVKYARKALGLRQTELAALLQCSPETLSRWETGAVPMKRAEQLALVALLDDVEQNGTDLRSPRERAEPSTELHVRQRKVG